MEQSFTKRAQRALNTAKNKAAEGGYEAVGPDHLLLGICLEAGGAAAETLTALGLSPAQLAKDIDRRAGQAFAATPGALERIIQSAAEEARRLNQRQIGTEHILFALLKEREGAAATVLQGIQKGS